MNNQSTLLLLGLLLSPLSIITFTLILGFIMVLSNRFVRTGKFMMFLSISGLYLCSTAFFSDWLLAPLEFQYAKFLQPQTPIPYIAVLGCDRSHSTYLPQSSKLKRCSQVRIHEALVLYKANPGAKVIFGGGAPAKTETIAQASAEFAMLAGISEKDIVLANQANNTEQEITAFSKIIGSQPLALVTSAAHMPRAMWLAKHHSLNATAAPTDYLIRYYPKQLYVKNFIPKVSNLAKVQSAAHEYYARWWYQLKRDLLSS